MSANLRVILKTRNNPGRPNFFTINFSDSLDQNVEKMKETLGILNTEKVVPCSECGAIFKSLDDFRADDTVYLDFKENVFIYPEQNEFYQLKVTIEGDTEKRTSAEKIIEKERQNHLRNSEKYKQLKQHPSSSVCKLPTLPLPKGCPDPETTEFILRRDTVSLFNDINKEWNTSFSGNNARYGRYLAGPNGVGKSITLYTLCCMARAEGFVVVYIPKCDTWCNYATEEKANYYFLLNLIRGMLDFLNLPTTNVLKIYFPTWHDLIVACLVAQLTNPKLFLILLESIFEELCNCIQHPVLLCFDEINALFNTQLTWNSRLAKDYGYFRHACNLSVTPLMRGLKLLSGTGHQDYLLQAPPGTVIGYTIYFEPWSHVDYVLLLKTNGHKLISQWIQNPNISQNIIDLIISYTGTVPRELIELNENIKQRYYDDEGLSPYNRMKIFLEFYENTATNKYNLQQNTFLQQKHSEIHLYINVLKALLSCSKENIYISAAFLDLSLIYYCSKTQRYRPTTPVAFKSIVQMIKIHYQPLSKQSDAVLKLIDQASVEDEKSRSFECVWKEYLLLNGKTKINTVRLNGTDVGETFLECSYAISFDTLKNIKVTCPTLFVPISKDYPVGDLILISPSSVAVIQITFQPIANKTPVISPKNISYNSIYNTDKFNTFPPGDNFAESLLSLTNYPSRVLCDEKTKQLVNEKNETLKHFRYIIISSKNLITSDNLYSEFPWIEVIDRKQLEKIWPSWIVNQLPQ